jgi:alkylated DNA nucleotide flippase Atl1
MSNPQRALQLWSLLALAATRRTVLTYEEVAGLTGLPTFGLAQVLGHVAQYCKDHHLPWLTALVVHKGTGKPPAELYAMMDVPDEQWKCFQYDWLKNTPSLDDVEKPWEKESTAA